MPETTKRIHLNGCGGLFEQSAGSSEISENRIKRFQKNSTCSTSCRLPRMLSDHCSLAQKESSLLLFEFLIFDLCFDLCFGLCFAFVMRSNLNEQLDPLQDLESRFRRKLQNSKSSQFNWNFQSRTRLNLSAKSSSKSSSNVCKVWNFSWWLVILTCEHQTSRACS